MKTTPCLTLALMLASGTLAHAQFALSLPKVPSASPSSDAGSDPAALLAKGNRLIVFSTIATDLAVSSAQKMLEAFPPAKIAKIKAKFAKYDELKSKRADKDQLDADSCTVASDAFEEMAKLNVEGYDKAKAHAAAQGLPFPFAEPYPAFAHHRGDAKGARSEGGGPRRDRIGRG